MKPYKLLLRLKNIKTPTYSKEYKDMIIKIVKNNFKKLKKQLLEINLFVNPPRMS